MPKPPKLLLDTSVLISAVNSSTGASAELLNLARRQQVQLLITAYILFETEEVIKQKFPKLQDIFLAVRSENILAVMTDPAPKDLKTAAKLMTDKKDIPILAAALTHKVDYVVTLDRRDFIENKKLQQEKRVTALLPANVIRLLKV